MKNIRRLRRSKGEALILEGPHLVYEAISSGLSLEMIVATPDFSNSDAGLELEKHLPRRPLDIDPALLNEITDSDSPRGILAVCQPPSRSLGALPCRSGGTYVFAEGLQDPGNLGALARVSEASGATGLILAPGSVHPHHPRALRGSAGSLLRLPVVRDCTLTELDNHLDGLNPQHFALVASGGDNLYSLKTSRTLVLLLGAEGPGLSEETLNQVDQKVTIPLQTPVESLNATVAAAIILFELRRQRFV